MGWRSGLAIVVLGVAGWANAGSAASAGSASLTFVASGGVDAGVCPASAPCATLQYAHDHTVAGGTVTVVTSGAYDNFIIRKAISVVAADGVIAAISVYPKGVGITVDAGTTSNVVLRGLYVTGYDVSGVASYNNTDLRVNSVQALTLDHVTLKTAAFGLYLVNGFVLVRHSLIDDNHFGVFNNFANAYMGESTVSGNDIGVQGGLDSYGDNDMNGNSNCDVCKATITEVPHDQ